MIFVIYSFGLEDTFFFPKCPSVVKEGGEGEYSYKDLSNGIAKRTTDNYKFSRFLL